MLTLTGPPCRLELLVSPPAGEGAAEFVCFLGAPSSVRLRVCGRQGTGGRGGWRLCGGFGALELEALEVAAGQAVGRTQRFYEEYDLGRNTQSGSLKDPALATRDPAAGMEHPGEAGNCTLGGYDQIRNLQA
ncbi:MAG: hypothetical protein ACYYK0_03615 [Candidatus Eutrophobiaceae bacterium]